MRNTVRLAFYHGMRWAAQLFRWSVVLTALATLSACATYDDPYYVHSVYRGAADAHVPVFYVTDRRYDPNFPGGFTYTYAGAPSCGTIDAEVPAAKLPSGPDVFASGKPPVARQCGDGLHAFAASIASAARRENCGAVMVFVHGFDTGFETAALRAAQFGLDTQWRCPVAAFSWTSSGDRKQYDTDLARARAAEPLFAQFLRALNDAGVTPDIVAHSMGTKLVLETLANNKARADQVIFAAPDIGLATDSGEFVPLARAANADYRRLTIYASHQDAVLAVSRRLNGGIERVGREPAAVFHAALPNVDVIDASDAPGNFTGHDYYGLSYEIIADMALVLADVPAAARLQPRDGARATLLAGEDDLPYRLNVSDRRAPDFFTRALRWLVMQFAD